MIKNYKLFIFISLQVYPQSINLDECGNSKNRKVFITLIPHLPIRGRPFKIDIKGANKTNAVDKLCLRGVESHNACQIKLTGQNSLNAPLIIMMTTSCTQFETTKGYSSVNVTLKQAVLGSNKFWQTYKFPEIKVRKCYLSRGIQQTILISSLFNIKNCLNSCSL